MTTGSSPEGLTGLLQAWVEGDVEAADRAMDAVYDRMRRIAAASMRGERHDHTLSPTALVHEAFLRLSGRREPWPDRAAFFVDCGHLMRKMLVDHARRRRAAKRSADPALAPAQGGSGWGPETVLTLEAAIEELGRMSPRVPKVVELKLFVGLEEAEIAEVLGVGRATVQRDWKTARRWIARCLGGDAA